METSCLKNENVFEAFEKIIVYTAVDKKLEDKIKKEVSIKKNKKVPDKNDCEII